MLGPTLETDRLLLRPPRGEDFDAYAEFSADPEAMKFLGGVVPRSIAWRAWSTIAGSWVLNGFSMFSFIEKESGRWVGRGGPWRPEGWPGTEVGWGIARWAQRRGYAKEAASAAVDWAFDALAWSEVIHCIEPHNTASIATAKSLGSDVLRRGVASPAPYDVSWDIYGQSREHWRARRSR
jgi:RimJ/RimL family protein N-acetyltransferase